MYPGFTIPMRNHPMNFNFEIVFDGEGLELGTKDMLIEPGPLNLEV